MEPEVKPRKVVKHTRLVVDHGDTYPGGTIYETIVFETGEIREDTRKPYVYGDDIDLSSRYPFVIPKPDEPPPLLDPHDGVSRITYDDGTVQEYLVLNCKSTLVQEYKKTIF